jgi:uncharacterized protein
MKIDTTIVAGLLGLLALVAVAGPLGVQPAEASRGLPEFPALTGRIVDEADILPGSTRGEIEAKLVALEAKSADQLVVVTLQSLRGRTIEDYGIALGRHWKLGQAGKNNGVVLLVAPHERKVRVEVGYGLESVLTDAVTNLIINTSILPRFRANDMPTGIARGVDDIIDVLTGDAAQRKRRASPLPAVGGVAALDVALTVVKFIVLPLFAVSFLVFFGAIGFVFLSLLVRFATWIHILPQRESRTGRWHLLDVFDRETASWPTRSHTRSHHSSRPSDWSSSSTGWSGASSSSGSFSGGGGDFGGGGSSGSW